MNREIFVDANVFIYLFGDTSNRDVESQYASLFSHLNKQGNKFIIDFIVISEIVNRLFHFAYLNYLASYNKIEKKAFRNTSKGKESLKEIYIRTNDVILTKFTVIGKAFDQNDIVNFLIEDGLDFNDKAIVKICQENSFVLLTNDSDFKNSSVEILTTNVKLLNRYHNERKHD